MPQRGKGQVTNRRATMADPGKAKPTRYQADGTGSQGSEFVPDTTTSVEADVGRNVIGGRPAEEAEKDPNVVDFDGSNDPEHPMNWSQGKKTTSIVIVTLMTLLSYAPSAFFGRVGIED